MKKIYLYLAAVLLLSACGKHSEPEIDYLPCRTEVGGAWGFIDRDGHVVLDPRFESQPSPVSDGLFSVQQGDAYQLYRFSNGEPQLLLDSLTMAGVPAYGLVPVCREAGKIAIVDKDGEVVFVLDKFEGQTVVGTASQYRYGYLEVETVNSLGAHHSGLVDRRGQMVLPPHYSRLLVLNDDLIWVLQETVDNSANDSTSRVRQTAYFVDHKGMMLNDKPHNITDPQQVLAKFSTEPEYPKSANSWTEIRYVPGFGYIGSRELQMSVLEPKSWTAVGQAVYAIAVSASDDKRIASDTYAYDRTAAGILSAYQLGLHSRGLTLPVSAPYVTSIVDKPAEEYNTFATSLTLSWQERDFRAEVIAQFDTTLIRQKYTIEHKAMENMYGQPVEMNKRKEDGYEYNPEADMVSVDLRCYVDSTHADVVLQKVRKLFAQQYKKREDKFLDAQQLIRISAERGCICLHITRDPQAVQAEAAVVPQQDTTMSVQTGKYDAAIDSAMAATDARDSIQTTK